MKKIDLHSLTLKNFKGIRSLNLKFNSITNIFGENGTGKTTVADAFLWLLFDKDSTDRKNFEIKTLDKNNQPIHGLEHSVTAELSINGKKKILEKMFKEKWTKKRGEAESVFTGHETLYYVNDVPLKKSEYEAEISSIVDESLFKLLTNPLYFAQSVKWQDRRSVLMNMIGNISDADVVAADKDLQSIQLNDMDFENYRKSIAAKKKKLNDEIKSIPYRIDELNNSIEPLEFERLKSLLSIKQTRLEIIEHSLLSHSKVDEIRIQKLNRANELRANINRIELDEQGKNIKLSREVEAKLKNREYDLQEADRILNNYRESVKRFSDEKKDADASTEQFRKSWFEEKEKVIEFDEQFYCPTCQRLLDPEGMEQKKKDLTANFNEEKAKRLSDIHKKGVDSANRADHAGISITNLNTEISKINDTRSFLLAEISSAKKELAVIESNANDKITFSQDYYTLKDELTSLDEELSKPTDAKREIMQLSGEKKTLVTEIDELKATLAKEESNKKFKQRIEELKLQERDLANQIAKLESDEFLCEKFIRRKVDLFESEINSKFNFVTFKLFKQTINGGIEETCDPLINGVPFQDANHASKINAGIDMINVLSNHYQSSVPLFIDARESVNEIIPPVGQVINLIVSKDKSLTII